jgi:[acyl-carrier-protein] S-malonyltransferase
VTAPDAHHPGGAQQAAEAQRTAEVIGWVDGVPVPRALLDRRLTALRQGPGAGALPAAGSREGRQLVRWTAQVLFTEALCAAQARRAGLQPDDAPDPDGPGALDELGAVQLGSITAAAWRANPVVGALFAATAAPLPDADPVGTPVVLPGGTPLPAPASRRLSLATGATPQAAACAEPSSIGWSTLTDLPSALAEAARPLPKGGVSRPLAVGAVWQVVRVDDIAPPGCAGPAPDRPARQRPSSLEFRAFARRLDGWRAASVRPAPGFEHPADPSQPDHTHRH